MDIDKIADIPIVFVMGKERSGTTLLQAMLNAHPNIVAPHESRIIIYMYSKYGHTIVWTEELLKEFCDELYTETRFNNFWKIDKSELLLVLTEAKDRLTYPLIMKIIYCMFSPDKEVKIIIDKNPVYYLFLPELQAIFPDAKYLHIVRDYRDNIASHRKVMPDKHPADLAYRWLKVNQYMEEAKEKSPQKWYSFKYELLVNEPLNYMKKICNFIDIQFYENMVTGFTSNLSPVFEANKGRKEFMKFHSNVYEPVNINQIGKWRTEMPVDQIQIIEAIAGKYGREMYGYETTLPLKPAGAFVTIRAKIMFGFFKSSLRAVYRYHKLYKVLRFFMRLFVSAGKIKGVE